MSAVYEEKEKRKEKREKNRERPERRSNVAFKKHVKKPHVPTHSQKQPKSKKRKGESEKLKETL